MYGLTVLLSAFLLFQVQPIIGKHILPRFGGVTSVWTACLLFFQAGLLTGYAYAHLIARLAPKRQAWTHGILVLIMLLTLPMASWQPGTAQGTPPVLQILVILVSSIGLPFMVLSSTGPLLQSWYSRSRHRPSPYHLYSLSNLGSLLALLSYPILVEPLFTLGEQRQSWSWGCVLFALLSGGSAMAFIRGAATREFSVVNSNKEADPGIPSPTRRREYALWTVLSAFGALLLLATTNLICQDTAAVPLLWVLPLALYLTTFIVCFHSHRWYSRGWWSVFFIAAAFLSCHVLDKGVELGIELQIASHLLVLFTGCMVCHGELFRLRPDPGYLTSFYLMVASGGAAAGLFVAVIAPLIFSGYWEFHAALAGTFFLLLAVSYRDPEWLLWRGSPRLIWTPLVGSLCLLLGFLISDIRENLEDGIEVSRNFYGVLRVSEREKEDPERRHYILLHGRIEHGIQFLSEERRYWPTSYYGPESGAGIAISLHPRRTGSPAQSRSMKIGVVGLGTGTMATYGEDRDTIRFYEINPEVVRISDAWFTYRRHTPARVDIVEGDARVSMEQEMKRGQSQQFDVLAVDAFNSDSIPVHLLTLECFDLYLYHLKEDGIVAFHISNRYLDLCNVIRTLARVRGMDAIWVSAKGNYLRGTDASDWVLITRNRLFLDSPAVRMAQEPWSAPVPVLTLWTDDYSNILSVLKQAKAE